MHFIVKVNNSLTGVHTIESEVPQRSVLGPALYTLYTFKNPLSTSTYTGTYADNTVIMSASKNKNIRTANVQNHLNEIKIWKKNGDFGRTRVNRFKSRLH